MTLVWESGNVDGCISDRGVKVEVIDSSAFDRSQLSYETGTAATDAA